jgi:4-hydroxy-2-oxovalerate aldolase
MTKVRILDATIRDGGYMVDHHYSRLEIAAIVGGLDAAGLPLIEVGHGNGVGSEHFKDPSLRAKSMPMVDDAAHAEVALRVAKHAQVGVVLTAGKRFAPIEYIDRIADLSFAFVRLAVMPDEVNDDLFAYVRKIKDRGMIASINMMQTYAKTPAHVGELAARAAGHGVDWFYIVDSAGGMATDEVKQYVTAILGATKVEVGLHAHNNLGCAVANCLAAVSAGATLVDGTLNGMGRATGNPATEQLAVALRGRLAHEVDLDALVGLGNSIRSLFQEAGNDPFDFMSGGALVHSRNVPKVLEAARKRERSPAAFLIAVGEEARKRGTLMAMTYSDELYDAVTAAPARNVEPSAAMVEIASEEIQARWNGGPARAIEELAHRSRQRHLPSVLHVSHAAAQLETRPVPWQSKVMGVTIPRVDTSAWQVAADRVPDYVLVDDGDPEPPIKGTIATLRFSFADVYARAVQDLRASLRNLGVTAIVLDADDRLDANLAAGDVAVLTVAPVRARVQALQQRGVRVVQPTWSTAVAHAAETLVDLHHRLSTVAADILDPEDPVAAARAYLWTIIRGTGRL